MIYLAYILATILKNGVFVVITFKAYLKVLLYTEQLVLSENVL